MKILGIISEMTATPITIGCHEYDKISNYCTLKYSESDFSAILSSVNEQDLRENYFYRIDELIESIKKQSDKSYFDLYAKKYNDIIVAARSEIFNILLKYRPLVVKAQMGLGPIIDPVNIMNEIGDVLYKHTYNIWNGNWAARKVASAFINKKNIDIIISNFKDYWDNGFSTFFYSIVDSFFYSYGDRIMEYQKKLNKTTPKCNSVKLTQDKGCNKITPISPNMSYPDSTFPWDNKKLVDNTWPKVESLIRKLV